MPFCSQCGQEIPPGFKFCQNCGASIGSSTVQGQRKQVFEGEIRKCPNCGEVLSSFTAYCPACGYEIRNIDVASAVRTLSEKLEKIESQRMTEEPTKPISPLVITKGKTPDSFMKKAFGWDFNENKRLEAEREAREQEQKARKVELKARKKAAKAKAKRFEAQKNREKAELIRNFPIPNTKEDILEFALLASSNIKVSRGIKNVVSKAWISKLDQVYKKAEISFGNHSDFEQIRDIYTRTMKKVRRVKFAKRGLLLFVILSVLFIWAFQKEPNITIIVSIFGLVIIIAGIVCYQYLKRKRFSNIVSNQ